ncbi:hypothetical protein LIER_25178 [Lithospermum erythrorhizon]|uniref:Uncharacterized protein n=1 Tax=Lithospermum erythrorhizon TaxID=34254 RepID=A0AAV3R7I0_LITER
MFSLCVLPVGLFPDDFSFLKVPLWGKFPFLPQRYWTKSDFGKIGSIIDVGLEPTVVPEDDQDAREDVCEELVYQEVVEDPRVEERFVRERFSYSEAFVSNLDAVGDSRMILLTRLRTLRRSWIWTTRWGFQSWSGLSSLRSGLASWIFYWSTLTGLLRGLSRFGGLAFFGF